VILSPVVFGLLTRREREITDTVFAPGNHAPADDIRARLSNPPGDSAVRMMLARLWRRRPPTD
jgi:hypothetical protein